MTTVRLFAAVVAIATFLTASPPASAQGVTTGAIAGTVTSSGGEPVEGAQIQISNRSTGFSTGGISRAGGSYYIQGLEVGGPYTVTVRRIGYEPQTRNNINVSLSTTTRSDFALTPQATTLSEVVVRAEASNDISPSAVGTKTTVSDTVIQRLPTATRNLTDFIKIAPQVSSSGPGYSGGGMSNRMNNVQIDGTSERDVFGLGSTGQPGGQISAKAISIEAVKEYQVLLAPFDVRQGNFGGLLLNAVTKSGTNDFHGSVFNYFRNQDYGRNVPTLRATPFNRRQSGFSLGGPIIKNRLHFFTANEWQTENSPVSGPYFGQPAGSSVAFPIADVDVTRFESILNTTYGYNPGTAGAFNTTTPMKNMFGRLDFQLADAHRLVFRYNYNDATNDGRLQNSRNATRAVWNTNFHKINSKKRSPVLQLFSNFGNGLSNEAFAGATIVRDRRVSPNQFPQISVTQLVNPVGGGFVTALAGTDQFSQGNEGDFDTYEFTDNLSIPRGNHNFTLGTRFELVKIRNLFTQSSYGVWGFRTLDSLQAGNPSSMRKAFILANGGNVFFDASQTALYAQDQWTPTPRLNMTFGGRFDIGHVRSPNSYALAVDTAYGHHETTTGAVQFSPRFGFNWDVTGNQVNQLRGGVGLFVGIPPYVWIENAYIQNGQIITFLNCTGGTTPAPAFSVDPTPIQTCRNGAGTKPIGDLSFVDKNLKFPQPMRATIAYDRLLGNNVVATFEMLYSKTRNQLFFVNKNLAGPQARDAHDRVMYGTIAANGRATQTLPPAVVANGGLARFSTAIDMINQNKDRAYNLTWQLRKRYADNWEGMLAYTFSKALDVQSFTSSTHISNSSFGRTLSGLIEDPYTSRSLFDQPHKIVGVLTRSFEWWRDFSTDVTVFYQGVSGAPHDYIYAGSSGAGDLNADGVQGNDLLYVPTDARDPTQIVFQNSGSGANLVTAAQQADAFEALIQSSRCLSKYRGQILPRNACSLPFTNTVDLTVRQALPLGRGNRVSVALDIFNFGNMLEKTWGKTRVSPFSSFNNVPLVTHVGMTTTNPATAVPIVTYNIRTLDPQNSGIIQEYQPGDFASNYWRMQLSFRYSF
ncbi:MAG TPA: carboxypeptidase regulatory-like domain-containing protein [Gemmatimonadaceae bacterium]|nr:carboxypeptidase regulatory-like domain-containing protein [Gemmatimonadaceae bacterium]